MTFSFQRIIFMQGDNATEALSILEQQGEQTTLEHLKQWDYDEAEIETDNQLPHGTADKVYRSEDYVMSYNKPLEYIGLVKLVTA